MLGYAFQADAGAEAAQAPAAKFGALQALAAKFNAPGGVSVSPYLQQISDDVILGNAANAKWTGGGAQAMPLGNLNAGSTQGQVDDLIGKWFLGTDLPSSSVSLTGAQPLSVTYAAVATPLFGPAGPSMSDVDQGRAGRLFRAGAACGNGVTGSLGAAVHDHLQRQQQFRGALLGGRRARLCHRQQ